MAPRLPGIMCHLGEETVKTEMRIGFCLSRRDDRQHYCTVCAIIQLQTVQYSWDRQLIHRFEKNEINAMETGYWRLYSKTLCDYSCSHVLVGWLCALALCCGFPSPAMDT